MKRIGVVANCRKPHAAQVLGRLAAQAADWDFQLVTVDHTARWLPGARHVSPARLASHIDVLLALGGDGSMLRAVRLLDGADIPVLGVNLGSLGFLTSVAQDQLDRALRMLAQDRCRTSVRSLLECRLFRGRRQLAVGHALNDVVIGWGMTSRIITLELSINREPVTAFACDGLILSTPTGSTGHSLSAGGPILHPQTQALVVSVICPHTLSNRPIVMPDSAVLGVTLAESVRKTVLLSIDGQVERRLALGDRVEARRSSRTVRFMHLPGHSYFDVLRQKLHWRGSSVDEPAPAPHRPTGAS